MRKTVHPAADYGDLQEAPLSVPVNPNNFPAKLWRIVNSPRSRSIRWDPRGEGVVIDQQLFEAEMLSPLRLGGEATVFKTTNFTSFIRQLNLYGFKKAVLSPGSFRDLASGDLVVAGGALHHFHNPHFQRDRPELLVNLKRLTSANKAKLEAGLEITSRPPNRFRRLCTKPCDPINKVDIQTDGLATVAQVHHGLHRDNSSPYHCHPRGYERTPHPKRGWPSSFGLLMGQGDAPSFPFSDKGISISVMPRFHGELAHPVQSSPTTVHVQQGLGGPGQKYSDYIPPRMQYRAGFYPPIYQYCTPGSMDPSLTGHPLHTPPSFSNYNYYQPPYPVEFLHPGNPQWPSSSTKETKKPDVNLDTVFQMVNELQDSPKLRIVKVETPEKNSQVVPPSAEKQPPSSSFSGSAQLSSLTPVDSNMFPLHMESNQRPPSGQNPDCSLTYSMQPIDVSKIGLPDTFLDNSSQNSQGHVLPSPQLSGVTRMDSSRKVLNNVENLSGYHEKESEILSDSKPWVDTNTEKTSAPATTQTGMIKRNRSPDINHLVDAACK
nr:PREDICTED: heat shock factor protein 5 [Lepisosteus oculatus]